MSHYTSSRTPATVQRSRTRTITTLRNGRFGTLVVSGGDAYFKACTQLAREGRSIVKVEVS